MISSDKAAAAAFLVVCAVIAVVLFVSAGCSASTPC